MARSMISTTREVRPLKWALGVLALCAGAYLAGVMVEAGATPAPAATCTTPATK